MFDILMVLVHFVLYPIALVLVVMFLPVYIIEFLMSVFLPGGFNPNHSRN
jgi:hypothetical protein